MDLNISQVKKVYLAGIGGIGLSALAYYFLAQKKKVVGSDLVSSQVTDGLINKGVDINFSQIKENVTEDIDLFLYSSALPENHPELTKAKELNIPVASYFEFLGVLSKQYKTIAVAGTNGKTTTTAMLGLMLEQAGLDPTVIVGSLVPQWQSNFRLGKSDILVVEACEWQAHMLELTPSTIILTNIAEDHLDYYKDLKDIQEHFQKFVDKLPADGLLIKNIDDVNSEVIKYGGQTINFGGSNKAEFFFSNLQVDNGQQVFNIADLDFKLKVPGEYNVYNAVSAVAMSYYLGADKNAVQEALYDFQGTWRRFEIVKQVESNVVISDYAHHPDSIRGLLQATKDFYPERQIVAVFQPHHHNRTKTLLTEFSQSFGLADHTIVSEIYQVSGREDEVQEDVSSLDLVGLMENENKYYAKDFEEAKSILKEINPTNSAILFIGAGDIDNLAREYGEN